MNNRQILEALKLQPLTDEEKSARHILGRLYGPIATCNASTRNGRKYNRDLWEKALSDDIFKEKIKNKSLFLELGHPLDREETDMEKICACIPEMPTIVDGDLYAYVDILDTNNGRLLKTLCDYGFVPGISSRGSGDVLENDEVDPETFFLETWDIVQLPAVKDARLAMCESINTNRSKLRKALTESFKKASDKEKEDMKEALDNLAIDIDVPLQIESLKESLNGEEFNKLIELAPKCFEKSLDKITLADIEQFKKDHKVRDDKELIPAMEKCCSEKTCNEALDAAVDDIPRAEDAIPWAAGEEPLTEEKEDNSDIETEETETEEEVDFKDAPELPEDTETEDKVEEVSTEPIFTPDDVKEVAQKIVDEVKNDKVKDDEEVKEVIENKVDEATKEKVEELGYDSEKSDNIDEVKSEEEITEPEEEIAAEEEVIEEPVDETAEAEDNGDEEVIESLKEAIRQKDLLENEVKDLKSSKAVSDAEVNKLKEELNKYRVAFARVSGVAAKTKSLETEIESLTEKLNQKDYEIKSLNESHSVKLTESVDKTAKQIQSLTEKLTSKQKELEDTESKLTEQANVYKQKLTERTEVAKKYKTKFTETLNKYIDFRASMLGVRPAEITNRLSENFTLNDIDSVCETILEEGFYMGTLPIGPNSQAKIKVNEPKQPKATSNFEEECFKDLLDLADL